MGNYLTILGDIHGNLAALEAVFSDVDELRPDAMMTVNAYNLQAFRNSGCHTLEASSIVPSMTLPCYTSIFHSVPSSRHGILDNVWHPMARSVTGLAEQLKAHNKRVAMIRNWDVLRDVVRPESLHFDFYVGTGYNLDGDAPVVEAALRYIPKLELDFTFVYFASIDVAGHEFGWMADGYLRQVERVDAWVGELLNGLPTDDMTVIIHSDHGGHDRTHGTEQPEDMTIPWMIAGLGVRAGHTIQQPVSLLDTAPTVTRILDVPPVPEWEGRLVMEAFL